MDCKAATVAVFALHQANGRISFEDAFLPSATTLSRPFPPSTLTLRVQPSNLRRSFQVPRGQASTGVKLGSRWAPQRRDSGAAPATVGESSDTHGQKAHPLVNGAAPEGQGPAHKPGDRPVTVPYRYHGG